MHRSTARWIEVVASVAVLGACSTGPTTPTDGGDVAVADSVLDAAASDSHADTTAADAPASDVPTRDVPSGSDAPTATDVPCSAGQTRCSNGCVDTGSDPANCGGCGHACTAGQTCTAGTCATPTACGGPPAGASANAAAALMLENQVRTAMGIPCATMVTQANTSAMRHCSYYMANLAMRMCIANPHVEVSGCSMYVGANFWDRLSAAGYTGQAAFEDMHFVGNGAAAVQGWIDSVWHRTPVLSPWIRDIGYGNTAGCDTMDFGAGAATPATVTATYPYANQAGVPTSFDGRREGPPPPMPSSGWPSGYPIHVYLRGATVSAHTLTVAGSSAPIAHVWLSPGDAAVMGLLSNEYVMYANAPLAAATSYRVQVSATRGGAAVSLDWTFTTQ